MKGAVAPCKVPSARVRLLSQRVRRHCRVKSRRDGIWIASQFIGWYNMAKIIIGVPLGTAIGIASRFNGWEKEGVITCGVP